MGKVADAIRQMSLPLEDKKKLLSLDREFVEMQSKIQTLESENLKLQAKVNPLQRDIERLKNDIQQLATKGHANKLDEMEIKILLVLSQAGTRVTARSIAAVLGINQTRAEYFLHRLDERHFIHTAYSSAVPATYALHDGGREYLVTNNLV